MSKITTALIVFILIFTAGCSTRGTRTYVDHGVTKHYSEDKDSHNSSVNKKDYNHPTMNSYVIRGIRYHPTVVNVGDRFRGNASWYGKKFHGRLTSNGERYNMYAMTAAHKTLPMNTIVKVTNRKNGLNTIVRINDRGPFIATRIIDLSNKAAHKIDMVRDGTAPVSIEILGFYSKNKRNIPTRKELRGLPQRQQINDYALQIASFSKIKGALTTQAKHDGTDGYKTIIKDMQTNNGRMFKVWLTGFKSEQEARDYKTLGHFQSAFIVKED